MTETERALMQLALDALLMSSPNLDSLHRWKDETWKGQRTGAIDALLLATAFADDPKGVQAAHGIKVAA